MISLIKNYTAPAALKSTSPAPYACIRNLVETQSDKAAFYGDRKKERALCLRAGFKKENSAASSSAVPTGTSASAPSR